MPTEKQKHDPWQPGVNEPQKTWPNHPSPHPGPPDNQGGRMPDVTPADTGYEYDKKD